jgi:hypothetical protein
METPERCPALEAGLKGLLRPHFIKRDRPLWDTTASASAALDRPAWLRNVASGAAQAKYAKQLIHLLSQ